MEKRELTKKELEDLLYFTNYYYSEKLYPLEEEEIENLTIVKKLKELIKIK